MGKRAMLLLLDERRLRPHVDFDAIVAASDHLLLGVLEILHEWGIHVPRDVATVGFDDIIQARVSVPPFTTGFRPSYEMGCQLVETLLALINGTPVPARTIVPSGLVIRQSCGCVGSAVEQARVGPVKASSETLDAVLASQRAHILLAMTQAVGESEMDVGNGVARLLDGFIGELKGGASGLLVRELDGVLHQITATGGDVANWQGTISALRQHLLPHLRGQMLALAEDLWQQARVAVAEMALLAMEQKRVQAIKRAKVFREIGAALITTFDIGGLMAILTECLPRLSIPSCYLSLYEDPNKPTEWSRLILAYNEHERIEIAPEGWRFPSRRLIPEGMMPLERRYSFVVKELYFQEHQIGFVLFGAGPLDGTIYEILRDQISSALRGALLIQEREQARVALETAYAEVEKQVEERTAELRTANQEMEALFERLLRQEKLATIGQITGSIAHELRNPLGAVKQSAFFLNRLYQRQQLHASNPKVKEHLALIRAELDIAERVISDLLQMTRMKQTQREYTNLRPLIIDAVNRCHLPEQIQFTLNVSPEPFLILADPSQLRQVLINIFTNAVQAIEQDGSITISAKQLPEDGSCVIDIEDTGLGIKHDALDKVFEPLYTTKAIGTGLGLSICKQIIEKHQGHISVKSQVGQGTTVTIVLPKE
jgi:signal transduction histidine kinase